MLSLELKEVYIHFEKGISSGVFNLATDNLSENTHIQEFIKGIEYVNKQYGELSIIGIDTVSNYNKALIEGKNNFDIDVISCGYLGEASSLLLNWGTVVYLIKG